MRRLYRIILVMLIFIAPVFFMGNRPQLGIAKSVGLNVEYDRAHIVKIDKNTNIPILMFHHIDKEVNREFNSTVVTPKELEEAFLSIKEDGYTSISMEQLNDIYTQRHSDIEKPIVITFDDGYMSNYEYAYPLLKKYNMKASIFVVTASVGQTPGLFKHFDWEQAREMEKSGLIGIYNHTKYHKTADTLSNEEFMNSVKEAQSELENNLGKRKVKAFAYPEGKFNENLIKQLKAEGFKIQLTVDKGINKLNDRPEKLYRINVPHNDGGGNIIALIDSAK